METEEQIIIDQNRKKSLDDFCNPEKYKFKKAHLRIGRIEKYFNSVHFNYVGYFNVNPKKFQYPEYLKRKIFQNKENSNYFAYLKSSGIYKDKSNNDTICITIHGDVNLDFAKAWYENLKTFPNIELSTPLGFEP